MIFWSSKPVTLMYLQCSVIQVPYLIVGQEEGRDGNVPGLA